MNVMRMLFPKFFYPFRIAGYYFVICNFLKLSFMSKKIYNPSRLFDGKVFRAGTAILVEEGRICALLPASDLPEGVGVEEYPDLTIVPAYKDLQIYGGNGQMFSLFPSVESLTTTYNYCRAGGATAFMATIPTSSTEIMEAAMDAVYEYWQQGLPGLLGLQLEGPYINAEKKGAHIERFIQKPDFKAVKKLIERGRGTVKMMTLAPECCPDEIIRYLAGKDILLSAGHSNATYEEAKRGFDQGITTCTHLYNAMSALRHRAPGLVGAAFDNGVYSSIVPDGVHVNEAAVRIASEIMGDRLFFITDAITETHTDSYKYILKEDHYETEKGTLAGSCLTMGAAVQKAIRMGLSPEAALKKASAIPAKVLGKDKQWGKIAPGYAMDWVLLDKEYKVHSIIQE